MASSTDPSTWSTYADALEATHGAGLGYMLGDGVGCIDLDHCIAGGEIEPWAREIIDSCPGTYVEVSQSGEGVHIFGLMPEAPGRRRGNIEVYSKARFIAMTMNRMHGAPAALADISHIRTMLD